MKKVFAILLTLLLLLPVFASCTQVSFTVKFIVDGEVYDSVSTGGGEIIAIPEDPVKAGYTFKGWYWDKDVWKDPFTANSLLNVPLTSDMKVYAYFASSNGTNQDNIGNDFSNSDNASDFIKRDDGTSEPVMNLSQVAIKNENFRDTLVSWYDDDYNYYVFNVGIIKNVPLTSTYAVFTYGGSGTLSYSRSIAKATVESIETSTSEAISTSVSTAKTEGFNIGGSGGVGNKKTGPFLAVEGGYSKSVTSSSGTQTVWTDTYKSCLSTTDEETNSITVSFDPSCQAGNYLYLLLGHINVYYAVVQPRNKPNTYYVDTYCEVKSNKYVLTYVGEDDTYPINNEQKIHIDPSFVRSLNAPTKYIEAEKTYEDITKTSYWDDTKSVGPLKAHSWWITIEELDDYFEQGYNKIEITYKFYTTGSKGILGIGGYVNVDSYLSPSTEKADHVHFHSEASSKGKWIEQTIITDLAWFKNDGKIYLILDNNNFTESFTVSKLTFEVRIYRE